MERCFGLLKAHWRCLLKHRTLHYHPHVASKMVVACCVLHNIALNGRLPPLVDIDIEEQNDVGDDGAPQAGPAFPSSQEELMQGRTLRDCLINRL